MTCRTRLFLCPLLLVCLGHAQDPAAEFVAKLGGQLQQHPFFGNVDFTVEGSHAPFRFYVQRPAKDDPTYVRQITNTYLPFLRKLTTLFEDDYVKPLQLQRSAQAPAFAIAVLASAGNYRDFSQAVQDASLHNTRAHYTPTLRLAVTYEDRFAQHNTNQAEAQALLHEFVHALQHAYSSTGEMPKVAWFNEGLADYRSACTHVASSLADPPMLDSHLATVANGHLRAQFRRVMLPLADLVVPPHYPQVIEAVKARPGGQFDARLAMQMFYAQSELLVRFLHVGQGGKYRAGFLDYTRRVLAGEAGLEPFRAAFAAPTADALGAIERDFLAWQTEVFRSRYGAKFPDLTKAGDAPASGPLPLPPPAGFDAAQLAFLPADLPEQLAGVRQLCARGDFEGALALLPAADADPAQTLRITAEQRRIEALIGLRTAVLADAAQKKPTLALVVDGVEHKGRFTRQDGDALVLTVGKEERRLPLRALSPAVLLKEGGRLKKFEGKERALELWLKWLGGATPGALADLLKLSYSTIEDLRAEVAAPLGDQGAAAAALVQLQRATLPASATEAAANLTALTALVKPHRGHPLLQTRKAAIDQLVRALAERAYSPDDAAAMGIRGSVKKLGDGRIEVRYGGPGKPASADFVRVEDDKDKEGELDDGLPQISYDGPTELRAVKDGYELIGSGALRWPAPLRGRQELEFAFEVTGFGMFEVVMCFDDETGSHIQIQPDGVAIIIDAKTKMIDKLGSDQGLYEKQRYQLRIVHDGEKQLETFLDGKRNAVIPNVGSRVRGSLYFVVRSSAVIRISDLVITGQLDPVDPLPLREAFVTAAQQALWQ